MKDHPGAYSEEFLPVALNIWMTSVYADDLVVLACTQAEIKDKTDKVWKAPNRVGVEIKAPKTKVMCINTTLDAECWQVVETDFHKLEAFHNECLRRICRIFWPRIISIWSCRPKQIPSQFSGSDTF